jgi:hypothetical protein
MAQLTPEQIKLINDYFAGQNNGQPFELGGMSYLPRYDQAGDSGAGPLTGYMEYEKLASDTNPNGQRAGGYKRSGYTNYDAGGNESRSGTMDWMGNENLRQIIQGAAIVGGAGLAGSALAGAGAAGGAGSGAAGAAGGGGYTFGTTGAIGGYGAATGTGAAWAPAVAGGAGAAGGATGFSFGVEPTAAELASGVHIPGSALPAGSVAPSVMGGAGGGAGGAGGAGSSLLNGAGGKLLGAGATLLGGLAGKEGAGGGGGGSGMDERMDKYIYGDQGVNQYAQNLLMQQMKPEMQAGWEQMRGRGLSLLNTPVAGNAFERFYGGKK